jgi:hypothetical protein
MKTTIPLETSMIVALVLMLLVSSIAYRVGVKARWRDEVDRSRVETCVGMVDALYMKQAIGFTRDTTPDVVAALMSDMVAEREHVLLTTYTTMSGAVIRP